MDYETLLTEFYRCKIEDTNEVLHTIKEFTLPIDVLKSIEYNTEREIAIKFPESELVRFLNDLESYLAILGLINQHPHLKTEYEKLLIMAALLQ